MSRISVIIPVLNASSTLGDCIDALLRQDLPAGEFEVIVVDNNSTDDSIAIARQHGVKVLSEPHKSAYAARNLGLREAKGDLVAFTDADCIAKKGWLKSLREPLDDPRVKVVMGRDIPGGRTRATLLLGDYDHFKEQFVMSSEDSDVYYGHTNNLMTRRKVLEETGYFYPIPRGADVVFVQRVLGLYGTQAVRYQPDAIVDHTEIRTASDYFRKAFIYGRSARRYRRIVPARPLYNTERFSVFRKQMKASELSLMDAAYLLLLLLTGVVTYRLGWLSWQGRLAPAANLPPGPRGMAG